jgi:cell division protein FtsL
MRVIFVEVVIAALALCTVWQSRVARREGHRLEELQQRVRRREERIQRCRAHISKLKSPQRIMRLVQSLGLRLQHPARVSAAPGEPPAPETSEERAENSMH